MKEMMCLSVWMWLIYWISDDDFHMNHIHLDPHEQPLCYRHIMWHETRFTKAIDVKTLAILLYHFNATFTERFCKRDNGINVFDDKKLPSTVILHIQIHAINANAQIMNKFMGSYEHNRECAT